MLGINTNVASLTSQSNLFKSGRSLQTSIQRLSSGLRINSSRDDAAGLAIVERMSTQIRGQDVARRNANDGISALQVADGALASVTDNIQRMRELAVQAANGTLNEGDRDNLNLEFTQLAEEVNRIVADTTYNGVSSFDTGDFELQIGANSADKLTVDLTVDGTDTVADAFVTADLASLSIAGIDGTNADAAITALDDVLDIATASRAVMGSNINRLEAIITNLDTNNLNLAAARGRILDADFAAETSNLTRTQILQQAGTAVLAQSNQLPARVLSLLG